MTKHLLAGVAAVVLLSGVAMAQTYPAPPPPPGTVVMPAAPPAPAVPPPPVPGASSSTTATVVPSPNGDHREVTIHKDVDESGKTVTEKETHREGISGSSETHTKTKTNPEMGTTTRSTTTTEHE